LSEAGSTPGQLIVRVLGDGRRRRAFAVEPAAQISEAGLAESRGGEAIVVPYLNGRSTNPFVIRLTQQTGTP
jgi:hypothetical protein